MWFWESAKARGKVTPAEGDGVRAVCGQAARGLEPRAHPAMQSAPCGPNQCQEATGPLTQERASTGTSRGRRRRRAAKPGSPHQRVVSLEGSPGDSHPERDTEIACNEIPTKTPREAALKCRASADSGEMRWKNHKAEQSPTMPAVSNLALFNG